jgi:hypothetical protein
MCATCSIWKNLTKFQEKNNRSEFILVLNAAFALIPIIYGFLLMLVTLIAYIRDVGVTFKWEVIEWYLWSFYYLLNHCQAFLFLGILWFIGSQ